MECDEYGFVLKVMKFTLALTQFHILLEMFNTYLFEQCEDRHTPKETKKYISISVSTNDQTRVNAKPFAPRRKPNLLFPKTTMNGIIIFP